jgi:hypothetical protein
MIYINIFIIIIIIDAYFLCNVLCSLTSTRVNGLENYTAKKSQVRPSFTKLLPLHPLFLQGEHGTNQ